MTSSEINKVDPIQKIEILLRNIISEVLSIKVGANWMENEEHGLGKKRVEELKNSKEKEEKRRHTSLVDQDLLSYTFIWQLRDIIAKDKNIDFFKEIFKDWNALIIYLEKVVDLRIPAKHHRPLYPHEMSMLEEIASEIEYNINIWHIGCSLNIKKYRFIFFEYVETGGKTKEQILELTKRKGKEWIEKFEEYFKSKGIEEHRISIQKEDFEGRISAGNIKAYWHSTSASHPTSNINGIDYKSVELKLWYSHGDMQELDDLIKFINKKYAIFTFELDGRINVDKLTKIAKDMAGLTPSSAQNHESVVFGITHFSRIGVQNIEQKKGEMFIQNDDKFFFKNAHNFINPGTILSYLTGNMPRRLMISLIKSSV